MAVLCGFYKNVHLSTVENPVEGRDVHGKFKGRKRCGH